MGPCVQRAPDPNPSIRQLEDGLLGPFPSIPFTQIPDLLDRPPHPQALTRSRVWAQQQQ